MALIFPGLLFLPFQVFNYQIKLPWLHRQWRVPIH